MSKQIKKITSTTYKDKDYKNVEENGILWDIPPSLVVNPKHSMKKRWIDFFQLRVFNWFPEAMLGKDWRPDCPYCGNSLFNNGLSNTPRLIFNQMENYWLNAPDKYFCKPCKTTG